MRNKGLLIIFALFIFAAMAISMPGNAYATANLATKYSMSCSACHAPAAPRLNAFGHEFRKRGYRLEEEVGKDPKRGELGNWISGRVRTGYGFEKFKTTQAAVTDGGNSYDSRNGFLKPDYTVFFMGTITKNLSVLSEIEWSDVNDMALVARGEWFGGTKDHFYNIRLGQMHTLTRIGWGGFDRPTAISTPDVLNASLTGSPVPFKIANYQRGMDFAYNFTPSSRVIAGIYNGVNQKGEGNAGNGQGLGDSDGSKDALFAYEQMIGESGFTIFGYYGNWAQAAGTKVVVGSVTNILPDSSSATDFTFYRIGATASLVFNVFDPKRVGNTELQGGYMYANDEYPDAHPSGEKNRTANAMWAALEQRLPHDSVVFYRYDLIDRSTGTKTELTRHTVGVVHTVQENLRLAAEVFSYAQVSDSYGAKIQAMLNF